MITFPIKYRIFFGIKIPKIAMGSELIAINVCRHIFGANVRKNGSGNKC